MFKSLRNELSPGTFWIVTSIVVELFFVLIVLALLLDQVRLILPIVVIAAVVVMLAAVLAVFTLNLAPLFGGFSKTVVEPLTHGRHAREAAGLAAAAGARGPITIWGRVIGVEGRCSAGTMPKPGDEFAVVEGDVKPPVCEHLREAILNEAARMERGEDPPDEPVMYQDSHHRIEVQLHRERKPIALAS